MSYHTLIIFFSESSEGGYNIIYKLISLQYVIHSDSENEMA